MYHRLSRNWKLRPDPKSKISVGEHVWHTAMQLVEATCGPDVTQQAPSTLKSLSYSIGSVDFPVGWDTSSLLGQTYNRTSLHCACVCVHVVSLPSTMFLCAEWMHTTNNYKIFMYVRVGLHTCRNVSVAACVCAWMFVGVHVQLLSSSVLVCVHCGLLSWLLFIKRTIGGYWAFPIHH